MKTTWAIICSLVLAGTPFLLAQTPLPVCRAKQPVPACCQHGCKMPCCSPKPASDSKPAPAVPAQTGGQNQVSFLAPNALVWVLPDAPVSKLSSTTQISLVTKGSPLYARNCARLI
ncbi:MAG: hypothetical protein ABSE90_00095 [Verrucomicrobiota bacterium]